MQEVDSPTDAGPSRAHWLSPRGATLVGSGAVVLAVLLGVLIVVREQARLLGLDEEWAERMVDIQGPIGLWLALLFDTIGGHLIGIFLIPAGITITLFGVRRPFAALYSLTSSIASALLVQILKNYFDRPRPEDIVVTTDHGSFPSGHVANAATMATALAVIFPFAWVAIAGAVWTVMMAISRT